MFYFRCDGKKLAVPEQTIPVLVSAMTDPEISISGVKSKHRTASEFASVSKMYTWLLAILNSVVLIFIIPKLKSLINVCRYTNDGAALRILKNSLMFILMSVALVRLQFAAI